MIYNNIPEELTPQIIKSLITKSEARHNELRKLYDRYKGNSHGVPILTRKYEIDGVEQKGKVNNKIATDFFGEIVDVKVDFFCGVPITYTIDKDKYPEAALTAITDKITEFNKINSVPDLDAETTKKATICGFAGRLLYHEDGYVKTKVIDPWELIFIGESMDEPTKTIRCYCTKELDGKGEETELYHADVYDAVTVYSYTRKDKDEEYQLVDEVPHMMPFNPLYGFANNEELLGDAEKVLTLIDDYDRTLSDKSSELGQFRLAYLAVYGAEITQEILKQAQLTGAFSLPSNEAKMEWLVKALDDAIIEHHLDRLERNIYRISKTPNMNDQSFAGDISGIALKFKFRSFEGKCTSAELKYKKSLRYQAKILATVWSNLGVKSDYLDYEFIFTRKYPQNTLEELQILKTSKGIIPDELAYSLVSFIDDPAKIKEQMDEEAQQKIDDFMKQQKENPDVVLQNKDDGKST